MATDDDLTRWITRLADGDADAAALLWQQYFAKLVQYAKRKLDGLPRRADDEEDVALSAMNSFYQGMAGGRFPTVGNRDDLWKLLLTITARKACAHRRRHMAEKRGGGRVGGESVFLQGNPRADFEHDPGIADVLGKEPTPELTCMVMEDCHRLLDQLGDEKLRQIAIWTLEGYSTTEIADRLSCVRRSVERKLERVRGIWSQAAPV